MNQYGNYLMAKKLIPVNNSLQTVLESIGANLDAKIPEGAELDIKIFKKDGFINTKPDGFAPMFLETRFPGYEEGYIIGWKANVNKH